MHGCEVKECTEEGIQNASFIIRRRRVESNKTDSALNTAVKLKRLKTAYITNYVAV